MIHSHTKAILLDAVGTVMLPKKPVADIYAEVGQRFGMSIAKQQIEQRFRQAFAREALMDKANQGRTTPQRERERWQAIVAEVFELPLGQSELFETLWEWFAQPDTWQVFPDVEPALRALSDRGWPIYLASNFDARLHALVQGLPELHAVRACFISSEIGWAKPFPDFFKGISLRLDLPLAQMLLVGDHHEHDRAGALAVGLPVLLIDRSRTTCGPGIIHSLTELCS